MTPSPADGELFDADQYVVPSRYAGLGQDAARTVRQWDALAAGVHPVGGVVHRDAPNAGDRAQDGPRCGQCVHLLRDEHHGRAYLKCDLNLTRGSGTDVRAWWPACTTFQERP